MRGTAGSGSLGVWVAVAGERERRKLLSSPLLQPSSPGLTVAGNVSVSRRSPMFFASLAASVTWFQASEKRKSYQNSLSPVSN